MPGSAAGDLGPKAALLLAKLGGELRAKILGLEDLADFDLGIDTLGIRDALRPFDGLLLRRHLNKPESGDELLRLAEWAIDDRALGAGDSDARALRARVKSFAGEENARPHELLVVLPHLGEE